MATGIVIPGGTEVTSTLTDMNIFASDPRALALLAVGGATTFTVEFWDNSHKCTPIVKTSDSTLHPQLSITLGNGSTAISLHYALIAAGYNGIPTLAVGGIIVPTAGSLAWNYGANVDLTAGVGNGMTSTGTTPISTSGPAITTTRNLFFGRFQNYIQTP